MIFEVLRSSVKFWWFRLKLEGDVVLWEVDGGRCENMWKCGTAPWHRQCIRLGRLGSAPAGRFRPWRALEIVQRTRVLFLSWVYGIYDVDLSKSLQLWCLKRLIKRLASRFDFARFPVRFPPVSILLIYVYLSLSAFTVSLEFIRVQPRLYVRARINLSWLGCTKEWERWIALKILKMKARSLFTGRPSIDWVFATKLTEFPIFLSAPRPWWLDPSVLSIHARVLLWPLPGIELVQTWMYWYLSSSSLGRSNQVTKRNLKRHMVFLSFWPSSPNRDTIGFGYP